MRNGSLRNRLSGQRDRSHRGRPQLDGLQPLHRNSLLREQLPLHEVKVDRIADLRVKKDSVKTACQDACPTSAISFGNLLENDSKVVRAKGNVLDSVKIIKGDDYEEVPGSPRNYDLLQPATEPMSEATTQSENASSRVKIPVLEREKLILNNRSYHWITERICGVVEGRQPFLWWILFIPSAIIALVGVVGGLTYLVSTGVGVWGNTNRVMWGWPIVNFVFWIGIGHAGTLISAILFLTRQNWRTSINRAAEAMTIFAVMCAGIFPAFHVGRVWMAWFLAPIPNSNAIWQNFKSPLLWDVFAVSTYFTVSLIFWFLGMVPDLATIRDRCKPGIRKFMYGIFALGWRGGNRQWSHYEMAYLLLAALSTPLVLSVHSVVSFDFATSVVPGCTSITWPRSSS